MLTPKRPQIFLRQALLLWKIACGKVLYNRHAQHTARGPNTAPLKLFIWSALSKVLLVHLVRLILTFEWIKTYLFRPFNISDRNFWPAIRFELRTPAIHLAITFFNLWRHIICRRHIIWWRHILLWCHLCILKYLKNSLLDRGRWFSFSYFYFILFVYFSVLFYFFQSSKEKDSLVGVPKLFTNKC